MQEPGIQSGFVAHVARLADLTDNVSRSVSIVNRSAPRMNASAQIGSSARRATAGRREQIDDLFVSSAW